LDSWKDGSSRADVKWRSFSFWGRTGFLFLTTAAVPQSCSSWVNCWRDGQGRWQPDLCYPNACWEGSCLCCSIYVATSRCLVNLKMYHRTSHWIIATGKHVLQPKVSGGNSCLFISVLAVFFPENLFQNKPYMHEWCFLCFPVRLTCAIALGKESVRSKQSPLTNLSLRRRHAQLWC